MEQHLLYVYNSKKDFKICVKELSRVLKLKGKIIVSIPKKTAFIYKKAKVIKKGYVQIKDDFFNMRNGEIMRKFNNEKEIRNDFSKYFKKFNFSSIEIEWFGLNYHFHIFVAEKNNFYEEQRTFSFIILSKKLKIYKVIEKSFKIENIKNPIQKKIFLGKFVKNHSLIISKLKNFPFLIENVVYENKNLKKSNLLRRLEKKKESA